MPTYDYKCTECNFTFEHFQSMTSDHLSTCPECGGVLKRLIGSGAGPIFKGTGFYQTDYKKSSTANTNDNKSSKSVSKSSTIKQSEKKDTKPAS